MIIRGPRKTYQFCIYKAYGDRAYSVAEPAGA